MPFVRVETSERIPEQDKGRLCAELSRRCAKILGKPEGYMLVAVVDEASMIFAGTPGRSAFVEVRSIGGLTPQANRELSAGVCTLVSEIAHVPANRVYLNFIDVAASSWGHDGGTFGG